ncbi:hypothetical protein [Pseudonocardia sp. TRM90224]|uniref:hypothetical protein n=1 Tax=Pseudonocardia sp. TRM90224 TaxID=2812678 RepID=UPI001E59A3C2|nr:hypothetical protein [Pseudonocardia sp. TRM90224]
MAAIRARRGVDALATVLRVIGLFIVLVIVLHIVLTLLDANASNWLPALVRDIANFFSLGLTNLFPQGDAKLHTTLNYGAIAIIWFVITSVVVRLVRRAG